jgi:tripartite ATP-independent transporter DctP family solute receptor
MVPLIAGVAGALALAGCGGDATGDSGDSGDKIKLVLAVETNPGDPLSDMLGAFSDALEEELGDRVDVDAHYGGAIGDETAILEGMRAGQIDGVTLGSDISSIDPIFGIMELPFLFSDRDKAAEFLDSDLGAEMSTSLEKTAGLRVLSYGENGFRHITNNKRPINTPADLKGIKLRVPEVPARVAVFREFGAVPTPLSFGEIYLALDQGVLDGQENPLKNIEAYSFDDVQKYLSLSAHTYSPVSLTMNLKKWQSLSPEDQQAVQRAADTAAKKSREAAIAEESDLIEKMKAGGIEVNEVDGESFRKAAMPLWDGLKNDIGEDFANRVLETYGR